MKGFLVVRRELAQMPEAVFGCHCGNRDFLGIGTLEFRSHAFETPPFYERLWPHPMALAKGTVQSRHTDAYRLGDICNLYTIGFVEKYAISQRNNINVYVYICICPYQVGGVRYIMNAAEGPILQCNS